MIEYLIVLIIGINYLNNCSNKERHSIITLETVLIKRVLDGDTVDVININNKENYRIRLTEIDAPEIDQPHGKKSTLYLNYLIKDKILDVEIKGVDKYQRTLGKLYLNGVDINKQMVISGNAWVYDKYVTEKSFYKEQNNAKQFRIGLWYNTDPIPPWIWRKNEYKKI